MNGTEDIPVNDGHESPVVVTFCCGIETASSGDMTDDLVGADKIHTEISSLSVLDIHSDSDMFKTLNIGSLEHIRSHLEGNSQSLLSLRNGLVDMNPRRIVPSLRLHILEGLGSLDCCPSVDFPISKSMTELPPNRSCLPLASIQVNGQSCLHNQVLHISPCQIGSDLQNQSKDTSGQRSGCGSSTMAGIAGICSHVGCVLRSVSQVQRPSESNSQ